MNGLVEIAPIPAVPAHDLFTYRVPEALKHAVAVGARVRIPLGRHTRTGVVMGYTETPPPGTVRALLEVLDGESSLPEELLELCRWTARYYLVSQADVVATVVPARMPLPPTERWLRIAPGVDAATLAALGGRAPARAHALHILKEAGGWLPASAMRASGASPAALRALEKRGVIRVEVIERIPEPPSRFGERPVPVLNPAQLAAANAICGLLQTGQGGSFLLHGVTGSGKTEVFLEAAKTALETDRDVLVLVPEIGLTHQLVQRTRERFGTSVAVLHSGLTPSERWAAWRHIRMRDVRVVVGARSAVFAPLGRLGLVVVDEEHDGAYKQEDGIRYNARDLAVVRARLAKGVVVLSSATPSAESFHAATIGRHRLLELRGRPEARPLPSVEIVDLRGRVHRPDGPELLSAELRAAIETTLARREQVLVFLNRRGFARCLQCPACGAPVTCPRCSVSLTWHRQAAALVCHHCHHHRPPPAVCSACGTTELLAFGIGTEQVEAMLRAAYPAARIARLDRDTAQRAGVQERVLAGWHAGTLDVLVGTQMVSKGHDVPGVTLVAVLLADLSLNMPDFRAAERTMQLLLQVAGRAGRGAEPGRVIVQSFRPDHPSIAAAREHDYRTFMTGELARREELGYPPFSRFVGVRFEGREARRVERAATALAQELGHEARALGLGPSAVLGPAPAPIERVRERYRWQVLLRATVPGALRALARAAATSARRMRAPDLRAIIDVDPYSM
jgi:primosomal protein N' (replication factor Y)